MAHHPFRIDINNLPHGGKDIEGSLVPSFFQLDAKDAVQATAPFTYNIHVERDENDLVLTGEIHAEFELECGRCLQRFPYALDLEDYLSDVEIPSGSSTMDLTDVIRDDILVALPSFPRCEDGNVEPRECPAQGRFEIAEAPPPEDADTSSQDAGVWDALNQLKTN